LRPSDFPFRPGKFRSVRALAWALASALAWSACGKPEDERPAASVNGERITYGDLARYEVSRFLNSYGSDGSLSPQQEQLRRLGSLRELIDQRLLLQKADAQGLVAADREVEGAMERHQLAYGSPAAFREFLLGVGTEPEALRTELRRQLTVERLLNREVSSRVRVGESEVREYYESNLAAFSVPEQQLHLAQILVTDSAVSPVPNLRNDDATDPASARRKIQRIREELEDGAEFEQLALHYSEDPIYASNGGDMGFIPQSALEKTDVRLRRALVSLQPGEFSRVVQTDGEYRILHLIGIEPAGQRDFDDPSVRDSIREVLANRKEQLLRLAFYEVERSRATIRNYLAEQIAAEHGIGN
jgi:peptidyl-prolyl cis-trans isomerase SurA